MSEFSVHQATVHCAKGISIPHHPRGELLSASARAALSQCAWPTLSLVLCLQVKFPLQGLDLSSYVLGSQGQKDPSQAPLYDCYAVSNHYGGLGGGHYTAFGQMPDDKKWYLFDDSRVEETQPEGVSYAAFNSDVVWVICVVCWRKRYLMN